jgi:hypothetical protein
VEVIHNRFQHMSVNEMKNLLRSKLEGLQEIQASDIDKWYKEQGQFCSGCIEGKMKEHARVTSTKPLKAKAPGNITVGDIMFMEVKNGVKKPLMIHVDVFTKMIMGVPLNSKTETECTRALLEVKAEYAAKGKTIKQLVFDREPGIVPSQEILNDNGIELILKAAGQKVGLAEVSIHLIREKARATKSGVHSKFGYLPPKQFNVELCLDSISVLNRIPEHDTI